MTSENFDQVDPLFSVYYRTEISCRETRPQLWFARLVVERKDSSERVGGIQCSGASQQQASELLSAKFGNYITTLPRPPHEWERIELRKLLINYRKFNDELTTILVALQKEQKAQTLTVEHLHDEFWKARDIATKGGAEFTQRLVQLSEQDRISLMTSPECVYQDPTNPWSLDDMGSRSALFDFIIEPSKDVIGAHQAHEHRRMGLPDASNSVPGENY